MLRYREAREGCFYSELLSEDTKAPLSFANLAVYVRETTLTAGRTDIRTLGGQGREQHIQACMYISIHRVRHV